MQFVTPVCGHGPRRRHSQLEEVDDQVILVLTHRRLASRDDVMSVAGGWHTHLDILVDVVNGRTPQGFWRRHAGFEAEYEERIRKA